MLSGLLGLLQLLLQAFCFGGIFFIGDITCHEDDIEAAQLLIQGENILNVELAPLLRLLGFHINQVFLQLGTDSVQEILFDPALRQLVMECAQIYIGAATAVAQVFFVTVSWIGFEGRFERGAAVR